MKNVKLSYGNVRYHLATAEIFQARNLCSYLGTTKTIHIVRQNMLSTIMLKNVELSYGNARFYLATLKIFQARNLCSYPGTTKTTCHTSKHSEYDYTKYVRFHLATPELFQARNLCRYPRPTKTMHVVRQNILRTIMLKNVISPGNIRSILGQ